MRTKDGHELSNALNVIFIELPKVSALEATLESNTLLENWAVKRHGKGYGTSKNRNCKKFLKNGAYSRTSSTRSWSASF